MSMLPRRPILTFESRAHRAADRNVSAKRPSMLKLLILTFGILGSVIAQSAEPESKILLIPLIPEEQEITERMQVCLSALKKEGALSALKSWEQIAELPDWVFVEKEREIAFVFARPGVSDDYRYAVVLGVKNQLIVVRAGGIGGTYELFVRPTKVEPSSPTEEPASPAGPT
jgi:hypothetical protein